MFDLTLLNMFSIRLKLFLYDKNYVRGDLNLTKVICTILKSLDSLKLLAVAKGRIVDS